MMILRSPELPDDHVEAPVCALNAVWAGTLSQSARLPRLGHLFLICPLDDTRLTVANTVLDGEHYLWLTRPQSNPVQLNPLSEKSHVLVLMLSEGFIAEMADFLSIPAAFGDLLHGIPLSQGDTISSIARTLATSIDQHDTSEEWFFEVVGQILRLLRLRHQTLQRLSRHKRDTITDLTARLLEARQFIDSHYLASITTGDVADHVALSEYHFARLFKAAFEVTVHQYVMRLRMDEARRLLESTSARVTDIALDVGYNSLSAFIRAFGKTCGMTPSAYLSAYRHNAKDE